MDSKADQPLLEGQRHPSYIHAETKEFYEPKLIEEQVVEHIELRDADAPTNTDGGQGETMQVTQVETVTKESRKTKKIKPPKQPGQPLTVGLNVLDRDEKNINGQVHINFDDVIAEPDGTHSFEPMWRGIFVIFQWTKVWVYRLLTAVIGFPLAFVWGLLYALAIGMNNYLFTPFYKLFALVFFWIGRLWGTLFRELANPVFEAFGRCFSGIRITRGEYCTVGTNTTGKPTTGNPPTTEPWLQPIV